MASDHQILPASNYVLKDSETKKLAFIPPPPPPPRPNEYAEAVMNMTLFDPPRWGWTALGGVADVLTPHEVNGSIVVVALNFLE